MARTSRRVSVSPSTRHAMCAHACSPGCFRRPRLTSVPLTHGARCCGPRAASSYPTVRDRGSGAGMSACRPRKRHTEPFSRRMSQDTRDCAAAMVSAIGVVGRPMSPDRSPGVAARAPRLMALSTSTRISAKAAGTPAPVRIARRSSAVTACGPPSSGLPGDLLGELLERPGGVAAELVRPVQVSVVLHDDRGGRGEVGPGGGGEAAARRGVGDDGAARHHAGRSRSPV